MKTVQFSPKQIKNIELITQSKFIPYGLNYLTLELSEDEINDDEPFYTVGDSLINQFYCGNWSNSIKEMQDNYVQWSDLLEYMQDHEIWSEFLNNPKVDESYFDHSFWAELGFELARGR